MHLHLPAFPTTDPVLFFAIATAVFLVVPTFFERMRVPGLIGLILVGAVVGPNGVNLLRRGEAIQLLGTLGLLYLMFLVGLELDMEQFRRHRRPSLIFGLTSFFFPLVIGGGVSLALGYGWHAALLLGAMFASHTLVAYPIASRLGIVKTPAVTTVLGGTFITDTLAVLVLAVVAGIRQGGAGIALWIRLAGMLPAYAALILLGLPRLARWFFRRFGAGGELDFAFALAMLFACSYGADVLGIEPLIGALLAGFALNRFVPEQSALMSRIRFAATTLFVPFFLLSVGMLVDVRAFVHEEAWRAIAALTGSVILAKGLAAIVTQKLFRFPAEDGWVMFGLSVSRAAATMAIALVGYDLGLFGLPAVDAVVVIIIVTCGLGPWAVTRWGREMALREERARPSGEAPTRIIVPISNPTSRDALVDLAILLRPTGSTEPLLPLMVVGDEGEGIEAGVARAERMLGHAVLRASGASVPVHAVTRVDHNVASGIARGVAERRASTVVLGWDSRSGAPSAVFGSVLDQLLERTRVQLVVARLPGALNAVNRVLVLVPQLANHGPGFPEAMRTIRRLAHQLDAKMNVLVIDEDGKAIARDVGAMKPAVPTEFLPPVTSRGLRERLEYLVHRDDLVVLLHARRGTLAWNARLDRLARLVVGATSAVPLMFVYPGEPTGEERQPEPAEEGSLDAYLTPERVVANLPSGYEDALRELLASDPHETEARRERILSALTLALRDDAPELKPGVVLPHVRVKGVNRPLLFLGLSREGVRFPNLERPAHVVLLLVSPLDQPEEHLRALSAIAQACVDETRLAELVRRAGMDPAILEG